MAKLQLNEKITIPEGVTVTNVDNEVTCKGPKGELKRDFHYRKINLSVEGNELVLSSPNATLREKKLLFTEKSLFNNMIKGVTEGYEYTLKICSGHFPMTVSLKGKDLEIKNFIGEKVPRKLKIKEGAEVKVNGDEIKVTGIDKALVGQVAADIEQLSRRVGFDRRIFQDGIYIVDKAGKSM